MGELFIQRCRKNPGHFNNSLTGSLCLNYSQEIQSGFLTTESEGLEDISGKRHMPTEFKAKMIMS